MVLVRSLIDVPVEYIEAMSSQQVTLFNDAYRQKKRFECDSYHFNPVFHTQYPFTRLMCERVNQWGQAQVTFACMQFIITAIPHAFRGSMILWAYTVVDIYHINERIVTLQDLICHFPFGLPTPEGIKYMWEKQCRPGINLLDNKANWMDDVIAFDPLQLEHAAVINI